MPEHQLLAYFCRYTGVTVLSAVGKLPPQHLVRSTGTAMSTTGSHGVRAAQRPPLAVCLHPRPGGQLIIRACAVARMYCYKIRSGISPARAGQAAADCANQQNGWPERQMLCKIVQSFLASATRALPSPDRLAIACAQSFRPEAFFTRDKITTAASYIRVRASVSPHREMRPLRSTSPD
jgi:hypothetical protein